MTRVPVESQAGVLALLRVIGEVLFPDPVQIRTLCSSAVFSWRDVGLSGQVMVTLDKRRVMPVALVKNTWTNWSEPEVIPSGAPVTQTKLTVAVWVTTT